jgi:4-methyl-5(b-hydroxyethyl)-thiazole monophosphate biosynthesis
VLTLSRLAESCIFRWLGYKPIASVCVSSIALGHAGILKGKEATTYHQLGGKRKLQLEQTGAIFIDRPVVQDRNIITSTGPGTAIEVALLLLEELTSSANAKALREKMRVPTPSNNWYQSAQVTQ